MDKKSAFKTDLHQFDSRMKQMWLLAGKCSQEIDHPCAVSTFLEHLGMIPRELNQAGPCRESVGTNSAVRSPQSWAASEATKLPTLLLVIYTLHVLLFQHRNRLSDQWRLFLDILFKCQSTLAIQALSKPTCIRPLKATRTHQHRTAAPGGGCWQHLFTAQDG